MKTTYRRTDTFTSAVIESPQSQLVHVVLTIPMHTTPSPRADALHMVYTEMLLAGSGKLNREAFHDALALLGSAITVSRSVRGYTIECHARTETLQKTLALCTGMVRAPLFAERELQRVRKLLIEKLKLEKDNARARAQSTFLERLTHTTDVRHPYSLDKIISEIVRINKNDLRSEHALITRGTWLLTVGGDPASCKKVLSTYASLRGTQSQTEDTQTHYDTVVSKKTECLLTDIPHKQNIEFSIGNALALRVNDPQYPSFVFGMSVLALQGGFAGRLMSIVREKEGLTYSIYGKPELCTATDTGVWRIGTFFHPKDAVRGITSTIREIRAIYEQGITRSELERFKAILNTRYTLIEDSLMKKVREAHTLMESGVTEQAYASFKSEIQRTTMRSVTEALQAHLDPNALVISGAGPVANVQKEFDNLFA